MQIPFFSMIVLSLCSSMMIAMQPLDYLKALPIELKNEIIQQINKSTHPDKAAQGLRNLQGTNREWRIAIEKNVNTLIKALAQHFDIPEELAALYLGTKPAMDWFNKKSIPQDQLNLILQKALMHFSESKQSEEIIKLLLRKGAKVLFPEPIKIRQGTLEVPGLSEGPVRLMLRLPNGTVNTSWGKNGYSDDIGILLSVFTQKENGEILVAGIDLSGKEESVIILKGLNENGSLNKSIYNIDKPTKVLFYPHQVLFEPKTNNIVVIALNHTDHELAVLKALKNGLFFKKIFKLPYKL